jgi:hypothetical protein
MVDNEIKVISDLIVYLSKVDSFTLALNDITAKEVVINWFDKQEQDALAEVNGFDSALKGLQEIE